MINFNWLLMIIDLGAWFYIISHLNSVSFFMFMGKGCKTIIRPVRCDKCW
jgi:hypothetical protein